MNILTRGLGALSKLVTRGFGKTLTIIITPVQPEVRGGGGGGYVELPAEKHPFELIDTKAIVVPIRKPSITVKVSKEELELKVDHKFTKYDKIRIIFRGIEND